MDREPETLLALPLPPLFAPPPARTQREILCSWRGGGVHFVFTWALATPTPVGTRVSITFGSEVFGSRGLRSPGDLQSTLRQW